MSPALDSALAYASRGWPVFPLVPNKKTPLTDNGLKDATREPAIIRQWFRQSPNAGVGIATGEGLILLDVDMKNGHDGNASLSALIAAHDGEWPATLMAQTPSGGLHYFLRGPSEIRNSAGKLGDGLDVRGTGGYVCVAPTVIDGKPYHWQNDEEIAQAPQWLVDLMLAPTKSKAASAKRNGVIPAGQRNDALFRAGAKLRNAGARPEEIAERLQRMPVEGDLDPGEIDRIADSAGRYEAAAWAGAHDPCTHLANAHRLSHHFSGQIRYVQGIGWYRWAPPWTHDELGVRATAHTLGKIIAEEAAELGEWVAKADCVEERERREAVMVKRFKWASVSESAPVIEHSLKMAAAMLTCKAEELDAKPSLFGLPSGVLDLETGEHREHRQDDLITKVAGCDFDPDAPAPTWRRFISEIFAGDGPMIDYVQTLFGYAMSGERGEHLLPIPHGSGANGKTTALTAVQDAFGDYAGTAAPGLLIQRGGNEHPTALADLQGKRLVVVSETGEAGRLNEEVAKSLSGGDRINARRMRQDFTSFKPTHLLFLQTNHRPRISGTDEGIWRRLRLLPFNVTIPAEKRDPRLPAKLRAELPGILAWCWQGWLRYKEEGFSTPAAVMAATQEYRETSDVVGAFLAELCELSPSWTESAGTLYHAYARWCEDNGERPRSQKDFGMRLSERGMQRFRSGGIHRWQGIRLLASAPCAPCAPQTGLSPNARLSHGD